MKKIKCIIERKRQKHKNKKNHIYLTKNIHTVYNEYGFHRIIKQNDISPNANIKCSNLFVLHFLGIHIIVSSRKYI